MDCKRFEQRLQRLLDQRRSPENDSALRKHSLVCGSCQVRLVAQQRLLAGLRAGHLLPPRHALADRVVSHASEPLADRRWRPSDVLRLAGLIAACLLLSLVSRGLFPSRMSESPKAVSERSGSSVSLQAELARPPHAVRLAQSRQAAQKVGQHPADLETDQIRDFMQNWFGELPPISLNPVESLDPIAAAIRPLAATLNLAIDALWNTFPVGRSSPASEPQAGIAPPIWVWQMS